MRRMSMSDLGFIVSMLTHATKHLKKVPHYERRDTDGQATVKSAIASLTLS